MLMGALIVSPPLNPMRLTAPDASMLPPSAKPGRKGLETWLGMTVTPPLWTLISSGPRSPTTPQQGPNVPPLAAANTPGPEAPSTMPPLATVPLPPTPNSAPSRPPPDDDPPKADANSLSAAIDDS